MKIVKFTGERGQMDKIQNPKDGDVAGLYFPNMNERILNLIFHKYYEELGAWVPHLIDGEFMTRINYTPVFWFEDGEEAQNPKV